MGPAEDGDRIETAIRIAALVTASFVRAGLTTLAFAYEKSNKDISRGRSRLQAVTRKVRRSCNA